MAVRVGILSCSASRRARSFVVGALVLTAALAAASGASSGGGERVVISGTHSDQQFAAGEEVRVEATVSDDVFVAGGEVVFERASAKNVYAVGHSVTFRGVGAQDVIAVGGGVDFAGEVADDLIAMACPFCPLASRRVHLRRDAVIGDDARLAGGEIDVEGRIGGDLHGAARRITLSGEVAGSAELFAERIVLAPGARVGGDLVYGGRAAPEIAPGAHVAGAVRRSEMEWFEAEFEVSPWAAVGAWVVFALALVVLGVAVQWAVPGLVGAAAERMDRAPWASLGIGFAMAVAAPLAAALLFATIVGIPLGLLVVALFAVALVLALAAVAWWTGGRIRRLIGRPAEGETAISRLAWTAAGIVVVALVAAIPFIGQLAVLVALLFGLGALSGPVWSRLRAPTSPASAARAGSLPA